MSEPTTEFPWPFGFLRDLTPTQALFHGAACGLAVLGLVVIVYRLLGYK